MAPHMWGGGSWGETLGRKQGLAIDVSQPCFLAAGVKLSVFDKAKRLLNEAHVAYDEECLKAGIPVPMPKP
jgi:hypothetical protein